MANSAGHRTFAAVWDWASKHEPPREKQARRRTLSQVRGDVLEIGVGVGTNWEYLPPDVNYVAIDPDPYMLQRARKHAAEQGRDLDIRQAPAEDLPFRDDSFDTVVTTLTLCSVEDLEKSFAEVRRVLRPGGEFRFWEHVRPEGRIPGKLADLITPAWRRVGAGCHPNRRTVQELESAGFELTELRRFKSGVVPMVMGSARAREQPRPMGFES